jgi:hypothetical protein
MPILTEHGSLDTLWMTAAEDRATRGRDPSADCGAYTAGPDGRRPSALFQSGPAGSHPRDKSLGGLSRRVWTSANSTQCHSGGSHHEVRACGPHSTSG